jgi:hypothetical protein
VYTNKMSLDQDALSELFREERQKALEKAANRGSTYTPAHRPGSSQSQSSNDQYRPSSSGSNFNIRPATPRNASGFNAPAFTGLNAEASRPRRDDARGGVTIKQEEDVEMTKTEPMRANGRSKTTRDTTRDNHRDSHRDRVADRDRRRSRSPARRSPTTGTYRDREPKRIDSYRPTDAERRIKREPDDNNDRPQSSGSDRDRRYRGTRDVYRGPRDQHGRRDRDRSPPRRRTPPRRKITPEPTDDERDRRTVFVQQLAARLRTKELKQFFEKVGPVVEAQIVKDRVSGRSKG